MRRSLAGAAVAALLLAAPAAAALPRAGVLLPGRSLGGIRLGEPAAAVTSALGTFHGICRGCATTTWYFTYKPFHRQGLAVELTRGRVSAVYTLWQPLAWHAAKGLQLGAYEAQVTQVAGTLPIFSCPGYTVLVLDTRLSRTAYYIDDGRLWGFGLLQRGEDPCR
ncbi:MAG: hypothetical protein JO073_05340 [Actinobacteria bacterium]|nr:hypothetical protein [Actinomycetota bacterium]